MPYGQAGYHLANGAHNKVELLELSVERERHPACIRSAPNAPNMICLPAKPGAQNDKAIDFHRPPARAETD
jgi:hypothetical protein